ncbi:MAG: hypothetical protein A3G34_09780 [Candidatus Lindowbacteria bacterium RIFCSPLOWO2_12_FULL_62_27]|nr:MAG: hypothetical protein A3G34_09780 [Candidatus Lindowbacteria bacterium RIFCSPLOWO2_12_FULL_62_27]OGH61533.1 MAG: hypothetical protein A3I06_02780 [Candidatus Lindowbacteria bacterium RIFCSPLOWO2_02_FULL_62_12]
MRTLRRVSLVVLCCLTHPAHAAEQKTALIGTIAESAGAVEVLKRGSTEWVRVTVGTKVGTGDQINTGIDGRAVLKFDNSATEIRPLTQFVVGRAMQDDKEFTTEMFLQVGKLVNSVDKESGKKNKFTVTTPTAVAGIRGTQQEIGFGEGFGTECKIEDGEGYMAPVQAEKLPPAVQMALGVGPAAAAAPAGLAAGGEPRAEAGAPGAGGPPGAGGAVSEAATGAAGGGQATAEAVAAALDNWLQASFDDKVAGEEGGAEEAPAEEIPLEEAQGGEEIVIGDGEEAGVRDPDDVEGNVDPLDVILVQSVTNITSAAASEAEQEAALISTEVSDVPASETALDEAEKAAEEVAKDVGQTTGDGTTTAELEDLFGNPPAHPTN